MLRNEPTLKPGLLKLPEDPVARDILIPGFRSAKFVSGAFGWFTAGWIGRLAPGLAEYLNRPNPEPINFTVAPNIFCKEGVAIELGTRITADEASRLVVEVFVNGRLDASLLAKHALDCLSWMIAKDMLRISIVVPTPESNYHPKMWLFDDGENQVIVRGSGNATDRGLASGIEHFDIDVSWIPESRDRVSKGINMLDSWSRGKSDGIVEVVSLTEAFRREIIAIAPEEPPQPYDYDIARQHVKDPIELSSKLEQHLRIPSFIEWNQGPYAHQGEAVSAWENANIPETGVIAMATGAGKTLTALICATRSQDRLENGSFLIVISAPSVPLVMQWCNEVKKFGVMPIAPSLEPNTNQAITRLFRGLQGGGTHVAIVTNNLLCTQEFQITISKKLETSRSRISTMLIADEAHTLGAESFIKNKPAFFERRIALSATPERQYDPDGTEEIFDFFGAPVYKFGLDRAIGFCLVPYNYYVHASTLYEDEIKEFSRLTRQIGVAINAGAIEDNSRLQSLLIARRRIIETGQSKIDLLHKVLIRRRPRDLRHALIYASAKNPEQFDQISNILVKLKIKWAPVTQETTRDPKKLQRILESFEKGSTQVLLAKKVLDEGVDIPSIREAFIVASSTIQREWIQRRGRVLRMHANKPWAIVHDFLALPPMQLSSEDDSRTIKKIVETELRRAYEFGKYARNVSGENGVHADLKKLTDRYWPEAGTYASTPSSKSEFIIAQSTPRGKPW